MRPRGRARDDPARAAPGEIKTPINPATWETPEALQALLTLIPYGRCGLPEDVAKAAVWLVSDDAD